MKQGAKPLFPTVDLPRRQPHTKEGKPAVVFTPAEIGACSKQLEHALIAKFSGGRPHVSAIEKDFRGGWKVEGRMIVSDLDGRHILVILESEKDVIAALTQAPRRVGTSLFRLFKWTPDFHLRKESTVTTVWVRFLRLRPDLFNNGILRCLCQPFGRFLDSDEHTKNRTRCAFARCCVEIDLAKPLPNEIWIDLGDGNGWWQEISFEGNLKYCSKCKLHGHILAECRKAKDKALERKGEIREQRSKDQRFNLPRETAQESGRQENKQDWIPVSHRSTKNAKEAKDSHTGVKPKPKEHLGTNNPFSPILVEEEEIMEEQNIIVEEEKSAEIQVSDNVLDSEQLKIHIPILTKSSSETHLAELVGKEYYPDVEPLIRSNSLSDLSQHCSARRLEYLREEFNQFHLVDKHLKRTKEKSQQAKKFMVEDREIPIRNYEEDIQQYLASQTQEEDVSQVPETQIEEQHVAKSGDNSQKKKKRVQVGKKPLTRAAKKQLSPKRS